MSRTERHIGKVRKANTDGRTVEQWCEELCKKKGLTLSDYYEDYTELVSDEFGDYYFFTENNVYEMVEDREFEEEDIVYMKSVGNDEYEFTMVFNNGATCLTELIEECLTKIEIEG